MYQYGNVAYKYQNEKRYKRSVQSQSKHNKGQETQAQVNVIPSSVSLSRGKLLILFAIVIVLAVLSLLMARSVILTEKNYDYLALEEKLHQLEENNTRLEEEIVNLRSPERILTFAEKELGMTMKEKSVKILSRSQIDHE